MDKKEEYAIAVIVLIALAVAAASIYAESTELGLAAAAIAIIAVLYAIYVIHADISEAELRRSYMQGYQDHARSRTLKGADSGAEEEADEPEHTFTDEEPGQEGREDEQHGESSAERPFEEAPEEDSEPAEEKAEKEEPEGAGPSAGAPAERKPARPKRAAQHRSRRTHPSGERTANTAGPIFVGTESQQGQEASAPDKQHNAGTKQVTMN
jgi:uncharacterized protein (DUF58 family)